MPKNDTTKDAPEVVGGTPEEPGGGFIVPSEAVLAVHPSVVALAELASEPPLCPVCPVCASTLRAERRTPDFSTHHTTVCDRCGYRQKVRG